MNPPSTQAHVRPATDDDALPRLAVDELVWASGGAEPLDVRLAGLSTRGAFIAEQDGEIVANSGSRDLTLGIPGPLGSVRPVPVEGLTMVGVHPDHHRRGLLREMVAQHLRWTRESGRTLSALKASEPAIYGRFGYGCASTVLRAEFPSGADFAAPEPIREIAESTQTAIVTTSADQAERLHRLWVACVAVGLGGVARSVEDITRFTRDVPESRGEKEPRRILWATRGGADVGFAFFRRSSDWSGGSPAGTVDVMWFAGLDAAARLALMERLTGLDLMTSVTNWVGADDPLVTWLGSPRALPGGSTDSLWLRIVDLPAAVAQRGYAASCDLVLDVRDAVLPEQAGRWRLIVDASGSGRLEPTSAAADLGLDIADLGAVWLGGQTVGARAAAGYVTEHRPGAVFALAAALHTLTGPGQSADF